MKTYKEEVEVRAMSEALRADNAKLLQGIVEYARQKQERCGDFADPKPAPINRIGIFLEEEESGQHVGPPP